MFSYDNFQYILQHYDLNHPVFEEYQIQFRSLNKQRYIVEVGRLAFLVEMINTSISHGRVQVLVSPEQLSELKTNAISPRTQPLMTLGRKGYEIGIIMSSMDKYHQRAFRRLYRVEHQQFKKAIATYRRLNRFIETESQLQESEGGL